jgi:hypothetical protein
MGQAAGKAGFGAKPPTATTGRSGNAGKGQADEQNNEQSGNADDIFAIGSKGNDLAGQTLEHGNLRFVAILFSYSLPSVKT